MDASALFQIFGRPLAPSNPLTGQITGETRIPGYSNPLTGQLSSGAELPTPGTSFSPFFMPNERDPLGLPASGGFGAMEFTAPDVRAASAPGHPGLQNALNKSAAGLSGQMYQATANARNATSRAQAQLNQNPF